MDFTPLTRTGKSVPVMLIEFAKEKNIPAKALDFGLISFKTYIERPNQNYTEVEDIQEITETDIRNSNTIIEQEYHIKIFPKKLKERSLRLSIAVNDSKTQAVVTIQKGSVFEQKETIYKEIIDYIYYLKLKAGLFITLFEEGLEQQIQKLLEIVPYDKPIGRDLKIQVALGIIPIPPVHTAVDCVYESYAKDSNSVISGVNQGDLILIYTKPKNGQSGRNCHGKYLLPKDPITLVKQPKIDNTVEAKESEDSIEYYAIENGYVSYEKDNLAVLKTLKMNSADLRASDNIDSGDQNKDVSVHIDHRTGESEDAIKSGVNVQVKELNVSGSIGDNVKIKTQDLNVDAQTHKKSALEVENTANIRLHRGNLTAKEAYIDVLESGKVLCHEYVHIKKMLGGEVIAPTIVVDELISNATLIASKTIEVTALLGSDNKLIIDPDKIPSYHEKIAPLQLQLDEAKNGIDKERAEINMLIKEHTSKVDRIREFQKRILLASKTGKQPMKQDLIRVRQFKKDAETLKEKQEEVASKEAEVARIENELKILYRQDLHGEIKVASEYDGHTEVRFVCVETKEKTSMLPEGKHTLVTVYENDNKERVIRLD